MTAPLSKAPERATVLIVDDDPAKLLSYEVILNGRQYDLMKAVSGREALDILLRNTIAVILMDVNMPDMDGFQLASLIRSHPRYKETAIIFVSAVNLEEADYIRGYQMGAVDYVSVPVQPDILCAKVQVFVELFQKTRQLESMNEVLESEVAKRTVELTQSSERQMVLAREVDHRAKNSLAVAQSIVRLTKAATVDQYVNAVEGRIGSLARAHSLLSEARWKGASLQRLVEEELAPFRGTGACKISVNGPDIVLKPANAQAIALAIHELATNAAKYGALSVTSGSLDVVWKVNSNLDISWKEGGLHGLAKPAKLGFGTRVISLGIETQLGGSVVFDWIDEGVHCVLSVPFEDSSKRAEQNGQGQSSNAILLVEDEPLVALLIGQSIEEIGYSVIGPFGGLQDALRAAETADYTGAILDVNLRGELVFPVADVVSKRSIPYLFTTGYGPEQIDRRFAPLAILQKPVDISTLQATIKKMHPSKAELPPSM